MNGLTIGQAAAFVGVTVKTVRVYHEHGLIVEPRRDSAGYRRYGSDDLLRLVQVRTLAAAGVPLAEIGDLLDADPDRFAAALVDVDRRLSDRIEELFTRRDMLRRMSGGDRLLLPDRACALLDRLPGLGFTTADVTTSREAMVLVRALVPEGFDDYLAHIEHILDDPVYVRLLMRALRAGEWEPDDPRIEELAIALADHLIANPALLAVPAGLRTRHDGAARFQLLHHHADQNPVWARLTKLGEERLRSADIDIADQFTGWVH